MNIYHNLNIILYYYNLYVKISMFIAYITNAYYSLNQIDIGIFPTVRQSIDILGS